MSRDTYRGKRRGRLRRMWDLVLPECHPVVVVGAYVSGVALGVLVGLEIAGELDWSL